MARKSKPPEFPQVFETFCKPGSYHRANLTYREPSVYNGKVSFRRYRVTFEEIEEPREVLIERIAGLWKNCGNVHHREPLRRAAAELGIELLHPAAGKPDSPLWRYIEEPKP